jgi:hypothetical protein
MWLAGSKSCSVIRVQNAIMVGKGSELFFSSLQLKDFGRFLKQKS